MGSDDDKWNFILSEIKYIRGKVDDINDKVSGMNTRLTSIENDRERDQSNMKNYIRQDTLVTSKRIFTIAIIALAISIITMIIDVFLK